VWIKEVRRPGLPDDWTVDGVGHDPRLEAFQEVADAILDVLHYVRTGEPRDPEEPDADFIPRPSELANFFKNAAEQIEVWTGLE
jgi:hypothetical protein